jgi:hypothetical protein
MSFSDHELKSEGSLEERSFLEPGYEVVNSCARQMLYGHLLMGSVHFTGPCLCCWDCAINADNNLLSYSS